MSNTYVAVSALIFAIVAFVHLGRLVKSWPIVIGACLTSQQRQQLSKNIFNCLDCEERRSRPRRDEFFYKYHLQPPATRRQP